MKYQSNPDTQTMYEALCNKKKENYAEKIPVEFRKIITKGWYINLLNHPESMPEELEGIALELYNSWVLEEPESEGYYYPWKADEIKPRLIERGPKVPEDIEPGGGAW